MEGSRGKAPVYEQVIDGMCDRGCRVAMFAQALQDDELLTQEGVLGNEVGFAASQISGGPNRRGMVVGLEPALDIILKGVDQAAMNLIDVC